MINWPFGRSPKKNAFVTVSTDMGPMLVNRFDYNVLPNGALIGVGMNLLENSSFDPDEINLIMQLLVALKEIRGSGVVMIDGGANVGVHALAAGRLMQGWGSVISIEAQERIFYALAGNVAMNNLFNVRVMWNALSDTVSTISIPVPDYLRPSSFGSLEMMYDEALSENIGQRIDKSYNQPVHAITIDSLALPRLDFLKLDVEGMEEQVLAGAQATIARHRPVIHMEQLKSNRERLVEIFSKLDYRMLNTQTSRDIVCVHEADPILARLTIS